MLSRLCQELDFTSVKPKLYANYHDRYKTFTGTLLGITALLAMVSLSIYFLYTYFTNRVLSVIYYEDNKALTSSVSLSDKALLFRIFDAKKNDVDPRIVRAQLFHVQATGAASGMTVLETENCDISKHINNIEIRESINFNISSYQCLKAGTDNLSLSKDSMTQDASFFIIYLSECVNTTSNNNWCATKEKIQETLKTKSLYFNYYFFSSRIDHFNVNNPLQPELFFHVEKLSYDLYYRYYDYFKIVSYTSDDGSVFEDLITRESLINDPKKSTFKVFSKDVAVSIPSFGSFEIELFINSKDVYKRFYPKLQSVLANIGGVTSALMMVVRVISKYISAQMMFVKYSNIIVDHTRDEEKIQTSEVNAQQVNSQMSIIQNHPQIHQKKCQQNTKENQISLSLSEAILPFKCSSKNSAKRITQKCEKVVKKNMNIENWLQISFEFDCLKSILLENRDVDLIEKMKKLNLEEYLLSLAKKDLYCENQIYGSKIEIQAKDIISKQ